MVSVIVVTYNPIWEKLRATLRSVLEQKNISFEIIIADDGSSNNMFEQIIKLFDCYEFQEYTLIDNENNLGTCLNFYNALQKVKYDYLKALSPGDLLYSSTTLKEWYDFAISYDANICFGNAVYYEYGNFQLVEARKSPTSLNVYAQKGLVNPKIEYLMIPDQILGAALLTKRTTTEKYLSKIIGKVKYCEDYFIKLYVADGGKILFFDKNVIWYEYGLGVSTNKKWEKVIDNEKKECAKVLLQETKLSWRWKKIWEYQSKRGDFPKWRVFLFPSLLFMIIKKKNSPHMTPVNVDRSNLLRFYL